MKKDEGWNGYFQNNHRYADVINGIGCNGKQFVNADDLREADTREKENKQRDIVRKVAFGVNYAIIGLENQEYTDYELPLRCMNYDVVRYQKQANEIGREIRASRKGLSPGEYMYGFRKDSKLYPTVTFVLYSGENWDGATSLHEILNFTNIPEPLKDQVQDYKINVVDIRHFENTDVFEMDVKQVFDFIRCSGDKEKLMELVKSDEYYQHMEPDAFEVVIQYTNSKELINMEEYKIEGGKEICVRGFWI